MSSGTRRRSLHLPRPLQLPRTPLQNEDITRRLKNRKKLLFYLHSGLSPKFHSVNTGSWGGLHMEEEMPGPQVGWGVREVEVSSTASQTHHIFTVLGTACISGILLDPRRILGMRPRAYNGTLPSLDAFDEIRQCTTVFRHSYTHPHWDTVCSGHPPGASSLYFCPQHPLSGQPSNNCILCSMSGNTFWAQALAHVEG